MGKNVPEEGWANFSVPLISFLEDPCAGNILKEDHNHHNPPTEHLLRVIKITSWA